MRPYLAIIVDSFREALYSRVLWILLGLITLLLLALAPIGVSFPVTTRLAERDIREIPDFAKSLRNGAEDEEMPTRKVVWSRLSAELQTKLQDLPSSDDPGDATEFGLRRELVAELNTMIEDPRLFTPQDLMTLRLGREGIALRDQDAELSDAQRQRLNRLALEASYRRDIEKSPKESAQFYYFGFEIGPRAPFDEKSLAELVKLVVAGTTNFFGATIGVFVAILVTASIIPNMFDAGSVNLLFSKPISRPLMYLAKFFGGCAFVLINATYLIIGLWLVVGWRFGVWHERFLYAIPVLMFLFAVYYSVSAFAGLIWRNTIMCVVASILFWLLCFTVGQVHDIMELLMNQPRRVVKITAAGDAILTVSESGSVQCWTPDLQSWRDVFGSDQSGGPPAFARQNRLLGPIYDPAGARIVAIDRSRGRPRILAGYAARDWLRETIDTAPAGAVALMRSPTGAFFVLARDGISKIVPTDNAKSLPINIFGMKYDVGPKRGSLRPAGPLGYEQAASAKTATMNPADGAMFVYGDGRLQRLVPQGDEGRYAVVADRELLDPQREAVLAAGGATVILAAEDGTVHQLAADSLETIETRTPFGDSPPRMVRMSADGQYVAVVFHNRRIWLFDLQRQQDVSSRLTNQGDLSTAEMTGQGSILIADKMDRVRDVELANGTTVASYAPKLATLDKVFRWLIKPIYTVFPKPGELKKTTAYLLTDRDSIETSDGGSLTSARMPLNPWAPVRSSAAFAVMMLVLACGYLQWQEF